MANDYCLVKQKPSKFHLPHVILGCRSAADGLCVSLTVFLSNFLCSTAQRFCFFFVCSFAHSINFLFGYCTID